MKSHHHSSRYQIRVSQSYSTGRYWSSIVDDQEHTLWELTEHTDNDEEAYTLARYRVQSLTEALMDEEEAGRENAAGDDK